jgi:insertion element IS1 protein InsB
MDTTTPVSGPVPPCPRCHATHVVRNGTLRSGSPQLLCRGCGRRFVAAARKGPVSDERRQLIRRLLLERLSLRARARVAGVSRSWLQGFVNGLYRDETPWEPGPLKKSRAS